MSILVFVYGTLKKGFGLHSYMGNSYCKKKDQLKGWDMYRLQSFPVIIPGKGVITGEVYQVNGKTLKLLDQVEGVDYGHYKRKKVTTVSGERVWVYYQDESKHWWELLQGGVFTRSKRRITRIIPGAFLGQRYYRQNRNKRPFSYR